MEDWSRRNMKEELRGLNNEEKVEKIGADKYNYEKQYRTIGDAKNNRRNKRQREGEIRRREKRARE